MIELRILCDGCQRIGATVRQSKPKAHTLRESLKKGGWIIGLRGAKDYCKDCKKGKR